MRILVGIPCLYGPEHVKESIESVISQPRVDILIIDNGADQGVKAVINSYIGRSNFMIISNPVNVYVNPAWNQIIHTFIELKKWDCCVIMNSDLIMQSNWADVLRMFITPQSEFSCIPTLSDDKHMRGDPQGDCTAYQIVHEGTPGIFITLTLEQAQMIYPIPEECKVWFGDNWIYDILRRTKFKTIIPACLLAHHYWSQTVQKVSGISELIEQDKIQWTTVVAPRVLEKIAFLNKSI